MPELLTVHTKLNGDTMKLLRYGFMRSRMPMGRIGSVDGIALVIGGLASEACAFTTAGVFHASGGRATH